MKLFVDPLWSWPVVVAAAAMLLTVLWTTYPRRVAHLAPRWRRLLLGLRLTTWLLILFLLLRPGLEIEETDHRSSLFPVVTDRSRSMGVEDGPGGVSRRETELKTLTDNAGEFEKLAKEVQLPQFEFDQVLVPIETRPPTVTGDQTAIGLALDELVRQAQGKQIVGVLLLSDGAQRALSPNDIDPRLVARRLADLQIPVHTVGFGASGLSESSLDLIAEDLQVSPTVFEKNTVVVSAKIRALGAANRELTVRLLVEDPSQPDPEGGAKMRVASPPLKLTTDQNEAVLPVELSYIAEQSGEYKLTLEVVPLPGEPLTVNNSVTTFITVLKGGISVAYFDIPRPEQKYIRRTNDSPDIRLDFKLIRGGTLKSLPLDSEWFEPDKYDVYMIGDVPARVFGPENLEKLARAVERGAGLMMTGGFRSFGAGGYAQTPLADLLPVTMLATEIQNDGEIDPTLQEMGDIQMLPTSQGIQHFIMRIDSPSKNLAAWQGLPPLQGATKFSGLKDLAQVLAVSPQKHPLLVAQEVGRARTMAFAGDTTYYWHLSGHIMEHQRFWQQAILWLAHKDQAGDSSVWVKLDARRFRPGQPIGMVLGARDATRQPVPDASFDVKIIGPKDKTWPVTAQRSGSDSTARFTEQLEPGEYRVQVEASRNGQPIGFGTQVRFIVYEQDLELQNPAADMALLEEISKVTGGTHIPPEQLGTFLRELIREGLKARVQKIRRLTLWDNWPVLLLFAGLLTAEWYVRKRRGLV